MVVEAGAGATVGAASGAGTRVSTEFGTVGASAVEDLGWALRGFRGPGGGSKTSRGFATAVALPPEALSLGNISSGTLELADLPATPMVARDPSSSLLLTPSSFASS